MNGRICLVTGANAGIGKETVLGLARKGATVVMACRNLEKGKAARQEIARATSRDDLDLMQLDLASRGTIADFVREFDARYPALHVLVNNAGIMAWKFERTADGVETTFGTNHLGPFLLTLRLLDKLKASGPARIVNVSSGAHHGGLLDFDDLQCERNYGAMRAYSNSKLANVLFTRELARRLEGSDVTVNGVGSGCSGGDRPVLRQTAGSLRLGPRARRRGRPPVVGRQHAADGPGNHLSFSRASHGGSLYRLPSVDLNLGQREPVSTLNLG